MVYLVVDWYTYFESVTLEEEFQEQQVEEEPEILSDQNRLVAVRMFTN